MPAKSKKQRRMMAIAEHHPSKLYKRNRAALGMSKEDLSEYASTKEKGLPKKKRGKRRKNLELGATTIQSPQKSYLVSLSLISISRLRPTKQD